MAGPRRHAELTAADYRELEHGIPRVEWEEMAAELHEEWHAGQHFSIFSPTEGGKSHLIRYGLLPLWQRYPVLWVRFKPKDDSTEGFGTLVQRYPVIERAKYQVRGRDSDRWDDDPEWYLLQLPGYRFSPTAREDRSDAWQRARDICGDALDRAFREGGWVLVVDEVKALSGKRPPSLDLGAVLEHCWERGRNQPLTVIAATQQPAWAPSSMYDQPRYVALGRSLDEGRHERLAELGGNTDAIEAVLPTLLGRNDPAGPEFLVVDRWSGSMWITVAPPASEAA
jgi:hypothetical protein